MEPSMMASLKRAENTVQGTTSGVTDPLTQVHGSTITSKGTASINGLMVEAILANGEITNSMAEALTFGLMAGSTRASTTMTKRKVSGSTAGLTGSATKVTGTRASSTGRARSSTPRGSPDEGSGRMGNASHGLRGMQPHDDQIRHHPQFRRQESEAQRLMTA